MLESNSAYIKGFAGDMFAVRLKSETCWKMFDVDTRFCGPLKWSNFGDQTRPLEGPLGGKASPATGPAELILQHGYGTPHFRFQHPNDIKVRRPVCTPQTQSTQAAIMSAPMIAWAPLVNRMQRYLTTSTYSAQSIDIPSVEIHDVETAPEKRPRTLKHLIRANHVNHSILYHNLQYHNHMPHLLGSAYLLGANVDQLQKIYDAESKELEEWKDSPGEISDGDWRDYLGDRRYQRAFVDFFEDELALKFGYDWKRVAEEYLFTGKEPLVNGVVAGRKVTSFP
jgi:hypothetical protein